MKENTIKWHSTFSAEKGEGNRGFVRILEAIIASLILLASLSFFFAPVVTQKMDSAIEQMRVEDVLMAMQKSGLLRSAVAENNVNGLNNRLRELMPQAVDFSVEINGIPNPQIRIACICTDTTELVGILSPLTFPYKERTITIEIQKATLEELVNIRPDVLFFPKKETMYDSDPAKQKSIVTNLTRFLENGTVFLFSGLTQADVNDLNNAYGNLNGFMGLEWYASGTDFHKGEFYDTSDPKMISYKIADYFAALSGKAKTTVFDFVKIPEATLNKIKTDERTVIKSSAGPNAISLVKANEEILESGKGRSVWFARYDATCPPSPPPPPPVPCPANEIKKLFKATVLWASGEKYRMDSGFRTIPTTRSSSAYSYFDVLDGFEPFQIVVTVWKIFE